MAHVSDEAQRRYRQYYWGPIHLAERCNHTKWSVLRYPNDAMAQLAGVSTEEYEDFYFRACLVDYEKMGRAMEHLEALMDRTDKVRIVGPGTDISFSIKGIPSYGMLAIAIFPTARSIPLPVKDSVNLASHYNCPSPYDGFLFRDVRLEFRDGKIVNATSNNTAYMNEILDIDEGARYVGEFALGVNPVIHHPIGDILFDEKIAGSFHLTPGNPAMTTPPTATTPPCTGISSRSRRRSTAAARSGLTMCSSARTAGSCPRSSSA